MVLLFSFSDAKVTVNVEGMAWPYRECYNPKRTLGWMVFLFRSTIIL